MSAPAKAIFALLSAATLLAAAFGGYWYGRRSAPPATAGMPAGEAALPAPAASAEITAKDGRKIVFYRNPMGLPDTSPVPKKDWMGMDYIPVYEGEETDSGGVKISRERVQMLGVRTATASTRPVAPIVRAVGSVQIDESRIIEVTTRYEGWIERLLVGVTNQSVRRGQPLMEIYAPELLLAQQDYAVAVELAGRSVPGSETHRTAQSMMRAALTRLRALDAPAGIERRLANGGEPSARIAISAPAAGIVLKKNVLQGMRITPGMALYQLADLSVVWLFADVFERDLAKIGQGQKAAVRVAALPGRLFEGTVALVYPIVQRETRTARVRIDIANADGALKPDMFADVELQTTARPNSLAIPLSAVIDSGSRQVVLVERGEGRFEPRPVRLGLRDEEHVEVLSGLAEGDSVVVTANFLIDAESNLRAALRAFESAPPGDSEAEKPQ